MARVTLPALRQETQTFTRFGVPEIMARTRWMFGFQRRLLRICECEIECPKPGPLPQTSQLEATMDLLVVDKSESEGQNSHHAGRRLAEKPPNPKTRVLAEVVVTGFTRDFAAVEGHVWVTLWVGGTALNHPNALKSFRNAHIFGENRH